MCLIFLRFVFYFCIPYKRGCVCVPAVHGKIPRIRRINGLFERFVCFISIFIFFTFVFVSFPRTVCAHGWWLICLFGAFVAFAVFLLLPKLCRWAQGKAFNGVKVAVMLKICLLLRRIRKFTYNYLNRFGVLSFWFISLRNVWEHDEFWEIF